MSLLLFSLPRGGVRGRVTGFDVRPQGWGQAVCAHESLAVLQLPLKCSSDQDEREGSPSPNHLALIAGRNASLHPPWGGDTLLSSLIPRLSAGRGEGRELGNKRVFQLGSQK